MRCLTTRLPSLPVLTPRRLPSPASCLPVPPTASLNFRASLALPPVSSVSVLVPFSSFKRFFASPRVGYGRSVADEVDYILTMLHFVFSLSHELIGCRLVSSWHCSVPAAAAAVFRLCVSPDFPAFNVKMMLLLLFRALSDFVGSFNLLSTLIFTRVWRTE